jgi:hypothetical protein
MVSIRKLLSRKFNIVCLNLAGLLTRFMLPHLPIRKPNSGFEESNIPKGVPKQFGMDLQLREQLRIFTGFPFNHARINPYMNLNSARK